MKFTKAARPVILGANGMVSCGHHLAALSGVNILREGGNAVDAALAAAFVMSVVKPEASGPGVTKGPLRSFPLSSPAM